MDALRKNFIKNNASFECINCGKKVEKHPSSSRNHCIFCLHSLHVDKNVPGDRKSRCCGLMKPESIDFAHQNFILVHKCEKCGKISKNIIAEDDNIEEITKLI